MPFNYNVQTLHASIHSIIHPMYMYQRLTVHHGGEPTDLMTKCVTLVFNFLAILTTYLILLHVSFHLNPCLRLYQEMEFPIYYYD